MKKILNFLSDKFLFISVLFLIAFIPLYPKLPIVGISHTWVYVRAEDFLVAAILTFWIFLVLFKKVKLKTPLTKPILLFWVVGAISTFHGVLLIFPTLANVFPNVAFFSLIRRVEYLSLFFIAYTSIKDRKSLYPVIAVLSVTLILVVAYGLGQKLLGFPAFLTGNEEFAKGAPLQLSALARVPSTFAGGYDLAAYLVLVIPIFVSLIFGFKNLLIRLGLLIIASLGFGLLFLTVSRISFFVLLLSLLILLILQKKKFAIISLAVVTVVFLFFSPSLVTRFGNTISQVNVLVDATTGVALGEVREVPRENFKDKLILKQGITPEEAKKSSASAVIAYESLPSYVQILIQPNVPTGESLPQGTGYINLSLSPIVKRSYGYFVENPNDQTKAKSEVHAFVGNFLVKRAKAYDLSFTTRFQGEWPKTLEAFKRNIFLGSGYGSVSLAVDNNYLRILGESGFIGFLSFISIFLAAGIFIKRSFSKLDSPVARSFILGFVLGTFGLMLNAVLIDVFEASKIAFSYWILMGISLGILHIYNPEDINIFKQIKQAIISPYAIVIYFFILTVVLLFPFSSNYFVGDDFTWLRWAADSPHNLINYFTQANGFFYRPGTRIYFDLMYQLFWLNQTFYHFVSIGLHFMVVVMLFILLKKILKNYALSIVGSVLFVILSGYHEAVFWISSTGFIFNAVFTLASLLSFIYFREKGKRLYLILSIIFIILAFLFHEVGVISPLLVIAYDIVFVQPKFFKKIYLIILSPLLPYLILRLIAQSHWFNGDYSYNILKLPYNVVGNLLGYFVLNLVGPGSLGFYESLRNALKGNITLAILGSIITLIIIGFVGRIIARKIQTDDKKYLIFGILFFVIALLPFLGLGNISSRYTYLASIGFVIIFTIFIKNAFGYLQKIMDKSTAILLTILLCISFASVQLFQLQSLHSDWTSAGIKSENFLISFQAIYKDYWADRQIHFYFANVPIKKGEAWVFPVGLKDALWFILQNNNIIVDQVDSPETAFSNITDPSKTGVFKFNEDGTIQEYQRAADGKIIPVN